MSLISIGQSGLAAAYAQLQTTGNNIANVNTPGYVRQEVVLEPAPEQYSGAGSLARGVQVADIRRNYDHYLGREVTVNAALAGADRARADSLGRLDSLLADTNDGLGVAIDDLRAAFGDLVNQPNDPSAREVAIRRADALAERFRSTADQMSRLAVNTDQRIADDAGYVNTRLESIAALNSRITLQTATGRTPADLMDQRDRLIDEVAAKLQLSRRNEPDGSVSLFSASGHTLVLSGSASQVLTRQDPVDPAKMQLAFRISGTTIGVDASHVGSGEIAGLLRFRDQDLAAAQGRVGQLAAAIASAYNQQQALGIDANGGAGAALFGVAGVQVAAAHSNQGGAEFSVTVTDPAQLAATDYRLHFDGVNYQLENLVDGSMRTLPGFPATIDGMQIELAHGSMTIGDKFTIKGASQFASGMALTLNNGAGLATGLAGSAQAGAANAGSVAVAGFEQQTVDGNAAAGVTITFTSATTFDVTGPGTGDPTGVGYVPGQPIEFNGWRLTLTGTPAAGDTVGIAPTANPAVDNRNARAMVALGDRQLVDGRRFVDAFAELVADVGSRTAHSQTSAETSAAMLGRAQGAQAASSGVNLDEEAARLLQYQQAYQASARVIAAANSMFDTILSVVSR